MVPQPTTADVGKVLASDGTWANVGIYDWATSTAYKVRDYFNANNRLYKVLVAHTSSTISADLNAGRIVEVSSRDYTWVTSTNNMTTADGDSVIIVGPHTINLPPSPVTVIPFDLQPRSIGRLAVRHGWLQAQLRLALVKLFQAGSTLLSSSTTQPLITGWFLWVVPSRWRDHSVYQCDWCDHGLE